MTAAGTLVLDEALAASLLPERDPRGHKATFGRLSVIAGSLDYANCRLGCPSLRRNRLIMPSETHDNGTRRGVTTE